MVTTEVITNGLQCDFSVQDDIPNMTISKVVVCARLEAAGARHEYRQSSRTFFTKRRDRLTPGRVKFQIESIIKCLCKAITFIIIDAGGQIAAGR